MWASRDQWVKYFTELVHTGMEPLGIAPPSSLALLSSRMEDYLVVLLLLLLVLVLQLFTTATIRLQVCPWAFHGFPK
jgi:hypothetical protein